MKALVLSSIFDMDLFINSDMPGIRHSNFSLPNSILSLYPMGLARISVCSLICPKPCDIKIWGKYVPSGREPLVINHTSLWCPRSQPA